MKRKGQREGVLNWELQEASKASVDDATKFHPWLLMGNTAEMKVEASVTAVV